MVYNHHELSNFSIVTDLTVIGFET